MSTKLPQLNESAKPMLFSMPIHKKDLFFLDRKGLKYTKTGQPTLMEDLVMIEIEINSGFDLADLLHCGKMIQREESNQSIDLYRRRWA